MHRVSSIAEKACLEVVATDRYRCSQTVGAPGASHQLHLPARAWSHLGGLDALSRSRRERPEWLLVCRPKWSLRSRWAPPSVARHLRRLERLRAFWRGLQLPESLKVLISTDMEGASGVVCWGHVTNTSRHFDDGRRYFTHDVNAAIEGCLEAGATEVLVTDNHAGQVNLLYDELHPEAELVVGGGQAHRPALVMDGLDDSFAVVILLGYHSAANETGVLAHSYAGTQSLFEIELNGMKVGETEIGVALAAEFGVPCGMVTGDAQTVEAAKRLLPDIEGVAVKSAIDYHAARVLPLSKTGPMIRDAARRTCERAARGEFTSRALESPVRMDVTLVNHGLAAKLACVPGTERIDSRVVRFEADNFRPVWDALTTYCYVIQGHGLIRDE